MDRNTINDLLSKAFFNKKQLDVVNALVEKNFIIEKRMKQLEGQLSVSHHVTHVLKTKLDDQEAYSRRPCLVVAGVDKSIPEGRSLTDEIAEILAQTGIQEDEINNNIDKLHEIGNNNRNSTQSIIVKFKRHSFKEKIYKGRKNIGNRKIKLRPSLTKRRQDLLEEANRKIQEEPDVMPVRFAFADVHGTLKVLMKDGITPKFQNFNSMVDFHHIVSDVGFTDPDAYIN